MAELKERGRKRIGKPNPRRGANSWQSKQVVVLGKPFGSQNEAERELNLGSGTVAYWIKNHPSKAALLTTEQYKELKHGERE
ncbi:MAG TPA: hypothetical protein VJ654_14280 [Noviherbaspirillum sp.]|nr:hypothetical protein [Noviherbaspirillum sp.]